MIILLITNKISKSREGQQSRSAVFDSMDPK